MEPLIERHRLQHRRAFLGRSLASVGWLTAVGQLLADPPPVNPRDPSSSCGWRGAQVNSTLSIPIPIP